MDLLPPLSVPRMASALAATEDCLFTMGGMTRMSEWHASASAAAQPNGKRGEALSGQSERRERKMPAPAHET